MGYDTTYLIRVISAPNENVWYYKKIGRTFEAAKDGKGKQFKFRISYLLAIPSIYCEVIEVLKTEKYTK